MKYRLLGNTGLKVSVLGYGASPLGSVFRKINETDGIRTVHTGLDLGINFIDVSPYYGLTRAEQVLGKALKTLPRDNYILATKVGRYGENQFDFSRERVLSSVDESLQRLGVEHIDIIQCHDAEFVGLDQIVNETLPALRKLQENGKVRFIGITGYPLKIFREVLLQTQVDTILSYCHYSLNDTSLTDLIPFLQERKIGIINASPLSMGLLTNQGIPDWHPASTEIMEACSAAAAFCQDYGVDIAQLAIRFSTANPEIASTLVGTANPENIKKNVQWADAPVDEDLLSEIQKILSPIHNAAWLSGLPENN
jgi:aryl-alcohol dehydrogenase-like predicted oxidoreductase